MMTGLFRLKKPAVVMLGVTLGVMLDVALPLVAAAQTITYGPMLTRGATPDVMIVRWGTQASSDPGEVSFRKKGETMFTLASGSNARDHEVLLKGLSVGTEYEYSVKSGAATSSTAAFHTCPAAGLPMDIVFYGDSRSNRTAHERVLSQIVKHDPEMILESGDLVPGGRYSEYLGEFFPAVKDLVARTSFMAAPGNHDNYNDLAEYRMIFPSLRPAGEAWLPYYSFVCGNSMFIALNSNEILDSDQQDWLVGRLRAASFDTSLQHVFVWFHHSAYSPGQHGDNGSVQSRWVPLFNNPSHKVTAVFSGHDHIYARMKDSSDVFYVVSGGAGADLYNDTRGSRATKVVSKKAYNFVTMHIAGETVSAVAYDDTDTELDRFMIKKPMIDPPDLGAPAVDMGSEETPPPPDPKGGCTLGGFSGTTGSAGLAVSVFGGLFLALARRRRARRS
jgi:hypothetical protein